MPGENPESPLAEDADHWIRVYSELVAFNQALLADSTPSPKSTSKARRRTGSTQDAATLSAELERLRRRLDFWRRRLAELAP